MRDKIVAQERGQGVVLDIGYHGVLVEVIGQQIKVTRKGERQQLGLEFTSLGEEATAKIQLFVQMLIQALSDPKK